MVLQRPLIAFLLAGAAGIAAPPAAAAQVVEGHVLDPAAGTPLAGVHLQLMDPEDRTAATAVSDESGFFRMGAPAPGMWRVSGELLGYGSALSDFIELDVGRTITVEIRMAVDPVEIEEPVVVLGDAAYMNAEIADFHRRRRRGEKTGLGYYIYGPDLERVSGRPSGLLRSVPGVSLSRGDGGRGQVIRMRGGCVPAVFIDGSQINAFNSAESLDLYLDVESIEGIEVYRGAQQPGGRFHDRNGCGLVLVWTHRGQYDTEGGFGWVRVAVVFGLLLGLFALR